MRNYFIAKRYEQIKSIKTIEDNGVEKITLKKGSLIIDHFQIN